MLRGLHETGAWDRAIERRAMDPRVFTVNISNVPGPRDEVSVFGGRLSKLLTIAEIGELHALRIAVVSASGRMFFGLCADPEIVPGLPAMAAGIESDIEALDRAAEALA
jgi:diacylglycerol O-acyltransferase